MAADRRCDLERGLHQLGLQPRFGLVPDEGRQHGVDSLDKVKGLGVEEHVLLLDAERVRLSLAELVLEHAAGRPEAVAGDGGRPGLLHRRIMASASISTSHRGSNRAATTTPVVAGRTVPKTSPCARPTSSMSSVRVTYMRVRTTSSAPAPACSSAARTMSRQRRAWPEASGRGAAPPGTTPAAPR